MPVYFCGKGNALHTTDSQREVVLNERSIQVPESEDFKPSNHFKPLKPE